MSGQWSSMSWKFYGHSGTGPYGCRNGIPLPCIISSLFKMTCSITWMSWCELWPRRRHNGRKTYTLPWSLCSRDCSNIILMWLQRLVCFSFRHISLILSGSCDRLQSSTREFILILKKRLLILHNTRSPVWSMSRMNTVLFRDICRSQNPKPYRITISSLAQWLQHPVNLLMIHMICLEMMMNT